MTEVFRRHEVEVIRRLAADRLEADLLESVLGSACLQSVEHTGAGYFLTVSHPGLPAARMVLDRPTLAAVAAGVSCGFVIFVENGTLTLECHAWGDGELPDTVREQEFSIAGVS